MAATPERAFIAAPIASAGQRVIASPFEFYCSGEDNLRLVVANTQSNCTVFVNMRFLDSNGKIQASAWSFAPNTGGIKDSAEFTLGVGAVLNLTVFTSENSPPDGLTFVVLQLIRGAGAAAIVLGTLVAGYVTNSTVLAFPGSPIQQTSDGPGRAFGMQLLSPGPGFEWLLTLTRNVQWVLQAISYTFTTSATVGNRYVRVRVGQESVFTEFPSCKVQTASQTFGHVWSAGTGITAPVDGSYVLNSLPWNFMLQGFFTIGSFTLGLQPADQFSVINLSVREWLLVF